MYISLNWIKDFVDLDGLKVEDIVNKFTLSCAEVEDVVYKGKDISKVITARIESVENHPNSKKLHLLKVNTGKEVLDIVCGAPNVRVGLITALATIGGKVGEVEINKAVVGGYESYGMCCSAKELGISDDNSGIIEFAEDTPIGVDIKEILPIEDTIIEVDNKSLTNRPDMWGHYGIAREISAITGRKLKEYVVDNGNYASLPAINVEVESDTCNRYSAVRIENVSKNVSPMEMQVRLYYCGMRAISLLADLTNYIMLELGQPMHSFNGDKVQAIKVRNVKEDTQFTTLDETERVLPKDTMVIDLNSEIGAIAGVMGGLSSEIEDNTNSTVLESANFDAVKIRKTATALGLRSESSARYEKSLDPEMTMTALLRYIYLLKNIDENIKVTSSITDIYVNKYKHITIEITKGFIDRYTGIEIGIDRMVSILESLGFGVSQNGETLTIDVPTWRATKDISVKADIVEEITRVYGYDNMVSLPSKQPVTPTKLSVDVERDYSLKFTLADRFNFHEIHSYLWENAEENKELGIETVSHIRLINSLQKDNDDLRSTMLPTMIRAIAQNKNFEDGCGVFEIGHIVTGMKDNLAVEEKALGMAKIFARTDTQKQLLDMKDCIHYLFEYVLKIPVAFKHNCPEKPYLIDKNHYIVVSGTEIVGEIGILSPKVQRKIDSNKNIILVELYLNEINKISSQEYKVERVSRYPVTTLDFNFLLDEDDLYSKIESVGGLVRTDLSYKFNLVDIYENKENKTKSYTIRYQVTSFDHTLSSAEIEEFHKAVIDTFEKHDIHLKAE
ncbi:MAG: phenylalanine--tRNA ligase subunit beta [Clostridiales bacterium]|nr:phenylalanine--tRNA ligase subunit beta [Clostridiales bacterium]